MNKIPTYLGVGAGVVVVVVDLVDDAPVTFGAVVVVRFVVVVFGAGVVVVDDFGVVVFL